MWLRLSTFYFLVVIHLFHETPTSAGSTHARDEKLFAVHLFICQRTVELQVQMFYVTIRRYWHEWVDCV